MKERTLSEDNVKHKTIALKMMHKWNKTRNAKDFSVYSMCVSFLIFVFESSSSFSYSFFCCYINERHIFLRWLLYFDCCSLCTFSFCSLFFFSSSILWSCTKFMSQEKEERKKLSVFVCNVCAIQIVCLIWLFENEAAVTSIVTTNIYRQQILTWNILRIV